MALGVLGAFLEGVLLADSEYEEELGADIKRFKGLMLGVFLSAVGIGINFRVRDEVWSLKVTVLWGLLGLRLIVTYSLTRLMLLKLM